MRCLLKWLSSKCYKLHLMHLWNQYYTVTLQLIAIWWLSGFSNVYIKYHDKCFHAIDTSITSGLPLGCGIYCINCNHIIYGKQLSLVEIYILTSTLIITGATDSYSNTLGISLYRCVVNDMMSRSAAIYVSTGNL